MDLDALPRIHYHARMHSEAAEAGALITDPAGILAVLLAVLATILWLAQHPTSHIR